MALGFLGAQVGGWDPTGLSLEPGSSEATPVRKPCQGDPTPPQLTTDIQTGDLPCEASSRGPLDSPPTRALPWGPSPNVLTAVGGERWRERLQAVGQGCRASSRAPPFLILFQDPPHNPKHLPLTSSSTQRPS